MSSVGEISQALGDYMLKGWVLTDQSCSTPGCTVPLLRSPRGKTPITTLCVKCDKIDAEAINHQQESTQLPAAPSSTSTESNHSPSSTPPTEFSAIPDSPVFIPLEESELSRRRREQSDQASSEIGSRLLKGWAMLGDECPNETCYGVPLVRPPKSGPEKDPRKECVICGHVYVTETDWAGREKLVSFEPKASGQESQPRTSLSQPITDPVTANFPFSSPFGRDIMEEKPQTAKGKEKVSVGTELPQPTFISRPVQPVSLIHVESSPSSITAPDETSRALHTSLQALSARLTSMTSQVVDPVSIGATADAISKVAQALMHVRQLQRDQR